jgi:uncharacterized protein YcaQ
VQADPIRAPARAQDLTLRHRVVGYRAGDLERLYATLPIEEDFFVNYGFLPRRVQALMHPRTRLGSWSPFSRRKAEAVLAFVRARGTVHPRDVDDHFSHGRVTNYWGGSSTATTHLLDHLHYRGLLRVVGRESGIRRYAVRTHDGAPRTKAERAARLDALIDVVVRKYAPLPSASLAWLAGRMRVAAPHLRADVREGLVRARQRLARARVDSVDWYWPADEAVPDWTNDDGVRLFAPFDPVVWDRRRFELFWGWPYRFEAYTPPSKRKIGYYALPLLWRERVIGWGNLSTKGGSLDAQFGYVSGRTPRDAAFRRALDAEVERIRTFLSPT